MAANGDSLFREDPSQDDFIDIFFPFHSLLISFLATRFVHYLSNCAIGKLDKKSVPHIHLPPAHMELHAPIWDRLQSSYDDVNAELDHIRKHDLHKHAAVRADPIVSSFNEHEHFLRILTAGFSQYLLKVIAPLMRDALLIAIRTQYCQMAVSPVYWGCALRDTLQTAYYRTRSRTYVGWDLFIARVNLNIRRHVLHHVLLEYFAKCLRFHGHSRCFDQ
eukprot:6174200-Pleurochrysis_carterae.AAC.7